MFLPFTNRSPNNLTFMAICPRSYSMKGFLFALGTLACLAAYAGEPYVKTFFKNKGWTVRQVGIAGQFKQCELRSSPHYLDKAKNPRYGVMYLEISYPSNNVTFSGENIGAYFKIAKRAKLQVDSGTSIEIKPETPTQGKGIIDAMLKGKSVLVVIDFGGGDPSTHAFSLSGFNEVYNKLPACAK